MFDNKKEDVAAFHSYNAFLKKLIDYAGIFPPTQLPLETAIRNYASYLNGSDAWMIGPFVYPAYKLEDLEPYLPLFSVKNPLTISALGRKGENESQSLKLLEDDLIAIERFRKKHGKQVKINHFEFPVPFLHFSTAYIENVKNLVKNDKLTCYCELPINKEDKAWEKKLNHVLASIAMLNQNATHLLGGKLRMGGMKASLIPTVDVVASFIHSCKEHKVPTKFTAGLHHPISMYRSEVHTEMHGFINVFVSGLMAHSHDLDKETITNILNEKKAKRFSFKKDKIAWDDLEIKTDEITNLRKSYLHSYGSCSFDIPRIEFRELNMIERGY